jgi:ABC-2 type transport system permease protein
MTAPRLLLALSLKRIRTLLAVMGLLLFAFQGVLILVARSIQNAGRFEQLASLIPPFAREMLGPSLASLMSFAGIVCVGYFHLAVLASLVTLSIAVATLPTSEIETGFLDLVLSRPLARPWIITRTIVVTVISISAMLILMMAGTWAGLAAFAPANAAWPSKHLIGSLALNLGLLLLSWSGIAMAFGSASRRRSVAGATAGLLAFAMFLLDYIGRLWQPAERIAWLSPFRYFNAFELIMGNPLPSRNVVVLLSIATAGFALAYVLFSRRDISH